MVASAPASERLPPPIFRRVTSGRRFRSAALLVGDTAGLSTKMKNSPMNCSMRRESRRAGASGASLQGAASASRRARYTPAAAFRCSGVAYAVSRALRNT